MQKHAIMDRLLSFIFIVPALILFITFSAYPLYKTFQLSLHSWDGVAVEMTFEGIGNYIRAFQDNIWWKSVTNGFIFALIAVILMNPLALLLAYAVYLKVKGYSFYRVIYYMPVILSGIVVGYIWKWIYEPYNGILNITLDWLGLGIMKNAWLSDLRTALLSVSFASIWQGFGASFLLLWAGLVGIPQNVYEAAKIDGATGFQQLRKITLPLLSKTYTIVSVLSILGAMQILPLVVAMTNGGPGFTTTVPAHRIYIEAFKNFRFGYASALSVILGVMMLIVSYLRIKISEE